MAIHFAVIPVRRTCCARDLPGRASDLGKRANLSCYLSACQMCPRKKLRVGADFIPNRPEKAAGPCAIVLFGGAGDLDSALLTWPVAHYPDHSVRNGLHRSFSRPRMMSAL